MRVPVKGYEGLYEVDTEGNVYSLGNHKYGKGARMLKPGISGTRNKGYKVVVLQERGRQRRTKSIHRIVAEAFIPNPNNLPQVNHRDENTRNNRVENLEWCTASYNKGYSCGVERIFKSPEGEIFTVKNVSAFCRENNLLQGNICKLITGDRQYHRGWSFISS